MSFAVQLQGITKRFGSVAALDSVDLAVEEGTIHAVVGENGAGKTTLMRVLYGALKADEGNVALFEKPVVFHRSREAIEAGIGMVSQHYGIIPALTCLENLILGAEGGAVIDGKAAETRATELARRMGFEFQWKHEASELSPAGAQKLEILKLLWRNAKVMILDEPTAMLSPADSDALFESMQQLVREGATVILVTHRLPEVMRYCKHVTVLRGGKRVADIPVAETSPAELAKLIVGGEVAQAEAPATKAPGEQILTIKSLVVRGERGDNALKSVDLDVRAGEIVGIAGVDGSGQRELFHTIAGILNASEGSLQLFGKDLARVSPAGRIAQGLRLIPEDRHAEGVIEEWSLEENSALGLQRLAPLNVKGNIDLKARTEWTAKVAARFGTKHGGFKLPMASLSGGNQQRFVAARALELDPKLILAFQPARGLDINGTEHVYSAIREKCEVGAGALVVSFDLDELLEHCDRIVVMRCGKLFSPTPDKAKSRDAIGCLMVGAA